VEDHPGEVVSSLIDLTGVDLDDPLAGSPVLNRVVQRLKDELMHPEEAVAGFQSSL